ncbi:MAG: hypothetical protein DYH03_02405 [Nitrospira sp. NTP1]|nr:hypothetical protein [Nitrospira sp. NTP1]
MLIPKIPPVVSYEMPPIVWFGLLGQFDPLLRMLSIEHQLNNAEKTDTEHRKDHEQNDDIREYCKGAA